jgi:hypothetical protein
MALALIPKNDPIGRKGDDHSLLNEEFDFDVQWELLTPLLEQAQEQMNTNHVAVSSIRNSTDSTWHYRTVKLRFSQEAVNAAKGKFERYYFHGNTSGDITSPVQLFVAYIPSSELAKRELHEYLSNRLSKNQGIQENLKKDSSPNVIKEDCPPLVYWRVTEEDGTLVIYIDYTFPCITIMPSDNTEWDNSDITSGGLGGDGLDIPCEDQIAESVECSDSDIVDITDLDDGGRDDLLVSDPTKPCPGDPIVDPNIAPSGGWNENGAQYGWTRSGGSQLHDGIDIAAELNTKLYAISNGEVTDVRNSFESGEYKSNSYGNFVTIKTEANGMEFNLKYSHLNSVDVEIGDIVNLGDQIGLTGNTGNAQSKNGVPVIPHVHVSATTIIDNIEEGVDPENFMSTKFNSDGSVSESKCQ